MSRNSPSYKKQAPLIIVAQSNHKLFIIYIFNRNKHIRVENDKLADCLLQLLQVHAKMENYVYWIQVQISFGLSNVDKSTKRCVSDLHRNKFETRCLQHLIETRQKEREKKTFAFTVVWKPWHKIDDVSIDMSIWQNSFTRHFLCFFKPFFFLLSNPCRRIKSKTKQNKTTFQMLEWNIQRKAPCIRVTGLNVRQRFGFHWTSTFSRVSH